MILVDEYQDSNAAQFKLLHRLVGPGTFICVVGDDDQSIYRFRGAEVQNILSFPNQYPMARTVKLEQNYRSTQNILEIANSVIKNNKGRHEKQLWTANRKGGKPHLFYVQDEQDEALRVASIVKKDRRYNESAILYRTNAQSVAFETMFKRSGIPYKVVGALQFYEREEVKDALALLFLLTNTKDEVNFKRMINKPTRGIGPGSQDTILAYGPEAEGDLLVMLRLSTEKSGLSVKAREGAKYFFYGCTSMPRRCFRKGSWLTVPISSSGNLGFSITIGSSTSRTPPARWRTWKRWSTHFLPMSHPLKVVAFP